jgi:L-threonylcarbamoyladenylate synthase
MTRDADAAALERCFEDGGVAIFPTDTVYGLGCNFDAAAAWRRIESIKGRPEGKPAAIMFFSLEAGAAVLSRLPAPVAEAASRLLPGAVTAVVPDPGGYEGVARGGRLGIRVPAFAGELAPLARLSSCVLQTSANPAGAADPRTLQSVERDIREAADFQLDGGELPGKASTVVDLFDYERDGSWRMLREGAVPASEVARRLSA